VDDEPQILRLVKRYLTGEGYHVITAQSRAEAEDAVEQTGSINVLITDIFLGDGWGGELAFTLQEMHSKIPVVFISGRVGEDPILRHGIEDHMVFLEKPFSLDALTDAVQKAMDGVSDG
jgi:DNA-binding NtrC family response regulator